MVDERLKALLNPRSIAIIGASRQPGKIGYEILRNLKEYGYKGKIFPVNPKANEILGFKCYPSVLDIPDPVDVAIVSVPAQLVPKVIEDCGKKGVKVAIIISSGFKEVGNVELEEQVVNIAKKYGVRIIGPNVFGYVYTPAKINATFGPRDVLPGHIAFVTQSGALGIALMGWTIYEKIGLSALIPMGNKADVDDADALELLAEDEHTRVILIYMEGVKDGRRFIEVARKVSLQKPIIVIKSGRSEKGAKAAASHTGSLAGQDKIYDAAFKQAGIVRAITIQEAFDYAIAFSALPEPQGENVVIITNGGGVGVMTTDACEDYGLNVYELPEDLQAKFRECMPPFGSPKNPVDLTGQADEESYRKALKIALEDDRIHSIIVLLCETAVLDPHKVADVIIEEYKKSGRKKPLVVSFVGGVRSQEALAKLKENGIPAFPIPERAVAALAAMYKWHRWKVKMLKRAGAAH